MISRETGLLLLFTVDDKSRDSLVPLIIRYTSPESVIITDKSSSYINTRTNQSVLDTLGYSHLWVNHTNEWVHSTIPEVHTQNIERVWRTFKASISHTKRHLEREILDEYVSTFILRYNLYPEAFFNTLIGFIQELIG